MEHWRTVIDHRGRRLSGYQVSDRGRVRSLLVPGHPQAALRRASTGGSGTRAVRSSRAGPRIKAAFKDRLGFLCVTLQDSGARSRRYPVHQLVAWAFLVRGSGVRARPPRSYVLVHLNGDRLDNRAKNLRWVTRSRASQMSMAIRPRRGIHARFTPAKVRAIRDSALTVKQLAQKHRVTVQAIYAIRKRHTWKDVQ